MLSESQLREIRELLEKSQNPLFFFDNDVDGLCSFLILQKYLGRGKGVPIRSFPDLNKTYVRKVEELDADAVFILDKPKVSEEFIQEISDKNIPIIWIDHHETDMKKEVLEKVYYFNSFPTSEPVTYLCYKISGKDEWLAMIGCIGDVYKPSFSGKFAKEFPELFDDSLPAFDALFSTEIGRVAKLLNFGLKDSITNVIQLIKYLGKANSIYDILEENKFTKPLHTRYKHLKKNYEKLIKKAESQATKSKLFIFNYSGDTSMSSELANGLYFKHREKFIAVIYKKVDRATISIRGKDAKRITLEAIKDIDGATGGGHDEACGAQVPLESIEKFEEKLKQLVT